MASGGIPTPLDLRDALPATAGLRRGQRTPADMGWEGWIPHALVPDAVLGAENGNQHLNVLPAQHELKQPWLQSLYRFAGAQVVQE